MKVSLGTAMPAGLRQRMTSLGREQQDIDAPSFTDLSRQVERETVSWRKDYALVQAVMAGVTCDEAARTLLKAGAASVHVAVLARALPRSG